MQDKTQYEKDWVLAISYAHDEEVMKTLSQCLETSVLTDAHKIDECTF